MTIDSGAIAAMCPDLPSEAVEKHLVRLPDDYRAAFAPETVAAHLRCVARLRSEEPVATLIEEIGDTEASVTVIAFDHPFEFSLIAGVLAGAGFDIDSGDVYTLRAVADRSRRVDPRRRRAAAGRRDPMTAAVIMDFFTGRRGDDGPFDAFAASVRESLSRTIGLLELGDEKSILRAKRHVNEQVTRRLAETAAATQPMLFPVDLDLDRGDDGRIHLTVTAQDTPAYLYALSTALSMQGLVIDRVRIEPDPATGRFTDRIELIPRGGAPVGGDELLERIKMSALLTKQFTYYLYRAPDPYAALERFERLSEDIVGSGAAEVDRWIGQLTRPDAMHDLARLLGTSDFIWEDFILGQYETIQPLLAARAAGERIAQAPETIPMRLRDALGGAAGLEEQRDRLNEFKDREFFQIDLEHILLPSVDFRDFSERLTLLAESLVRTAARLIHDDLVRTYGAPPRVPGGGLSYAVFGLGKLGGVALGYASDIELLFVYGGEATARTAGGERDPIAASEFFELLARETSTFIRTKRAGIFEVDLRLRPFGSQGPLAVSAEHFEAYYGPGGDAHPFERLALVRLRWIAGDPELGYRIEQDRNHFVYDLPPADSELEALWEIWDRVKAEKLGASAAAHAPVSGRNAKYSPGALVDLEGTVQLLQVTHASRAPQLRAPRLSSAMDALHRAGVLDAADYAHLRGAYEFLRRLINALRMLRGNAQDLFLPPEEGLEITHLARRLRVSSGSGDPEAQVLLRSFDQHTAAVRAFIEGHFGRKCPGVERREKREEHDRVRDGLSSKWFHGTPSVAFGEQSWMMFRAAVVRRRSAHRSGWYFRA